MKTILALFLSVSITTAAVAQSNPERDEAKRAIFGKDKTPGPRDADDRDVVYGSNDRTIYGGSDRYPDRYPASSRAQRIYEINRYYDAKIYSIRHNRTLTYREKERIIRQLEADRRHKIAAIRGGYDDRNRCDDDEEYENGRQHKKNHGNHYGWERGKGNPHHEED